jgi:hypothetical protein
VMTTAELTFFLLCSVLGWMDRVPVFERNVARGGLCIVKREEGERPCGGGSLWVGHGHVMHVSVRHPSIISVWTHVPAPSTEAVRTFDFLDSKHFSKDSVKEIHVYRTP